jgi:hypothetical protein
MGGRNLGAERSLENDRASGYRTVSRSTTNETMAGLEISAGIAAQCAMHDEDACGQQSEW